VIDDVNNLRHRCVESCEQRHKRERVFGILGPVEGNDNGTSRIVRGHSGKLQTDRLPGDSTPRQNRLRRSKPERTWTDREGQGDLVVAVWIHLWGPNNPSGGLTCPGKPIQMEVEFGLKSLDSQTPSYGLCRAAKKSSSERPTSFAICRSSVGEMSRPW
jgi:hypothetical protein